MDILSLCQFVPGPNVLQERLACLGIGGCFASESPAGFNRNARLLCVGTRRQVEARPMRLSSVGSVVGSVLAGWAEARCGRILGGFPRTHYGLAAGSIFLG
jgi:hypothetical protein